MESGRVLEFLTDDSCRLFALAQADLAEGRAIDPSCLLRAFFKTKLGKSLHSVAISQPPQTESSSVKIDLPDGQEIQVTSEVRTILDRGIDLCDELKHSFVAPEHLILALLSTDYGNLIEASNEREVLSSVLARSLTERLNTRLQADPQEQQVFVSGLHSAAMALASPGFAKRVTVAEFILKDRSCKEVLSGKPSSEFLTHFQSAGFTSEIVQSVSERPENFYQSLVLDTWNLLEVFDVARSVEAIARLIQVGRELARLHEGPDWDKCIERAWPLGVMKVRGINREDVNSVLDIYQAGPEAESTAPERPSEF